jgi:hypothetical protein
MKNFKLFALALLAFTLVAPPAYAGDKPIGTITSTGASVNNQTTATPFNLPTGDVFVISVQCDGAAYVGMGMGSATAATSKNLKVKADDIYDIPTNQDTVAILPVASGTVNCNVFHHRNV